MDFLTITPEKASTELNKPCAFVRMQAQYNPASKLCNANCLLFLKYHLASLLINGAMQSYYHLIIMIDFIYNLQVFSFLYMTWEMGTCFFF